MDLNMVVKPQTVAKLINARLDEIFANVNVNKPSDFNQVAKAKHILGWYSGGFFPIAYYCAKTCNLFDYGDVERKKAYSLFLQEIKSPKNPQSRAASAIKYNFNCFISVSLKNYLKMEKKTDYCGLVFDLVLLPVYLKIAKMEQDFLQAIANEN